MMLSDWKRKNNSMTIFESQIKGLIALSLTLAIIPFFSFFYSLFISYKAPTLIDQFSDSLAIEIVERNRIKGIYFVRPETSAQQFLKSAGIGEFLTKDFPLKNGMQIIIDADAENGTVAISEMDAAKKLLLGLRLDINRVTENELMLISGIGEVTAKKIIELRAKLGRFRAIEQLMSIKGIKEKKLAKFCKYLYVENKKR
jgi:competence protein ComEA